MAGMEQHQPNLSSFVVTQFGIIETAEQRAHRELTEDVLGLTRGNFYGQPHVQKTGAEEKASTTYFLSRNRLDTL